MRKENADLLAATQNYGKIKELEELLRSLPVQLRSLNEFPNVAEALETGATFIENAVLKARSYASQTKICALADDSGLEVEALDGAPGVFSARYAGENAGDTEKIKKLLKELDATRNQNRRARFVCAMAIVDAAGEVKYIAEGICDGSIAFAPRGTNGFGYDPIFIPEGFTETFGELSADTKQRLSHRAKAALKIIQYLQAFYITSG